jgi:membrane associated rhomboid family serine protease
MPPTATIQAQSQRQAMDWSLVLISQGIEAIIEKAEQGYFLVIPAENYDAALDAIRKYRAENRSWPWRHVVFKQGLIFDWASLAWVVLIVVFHWLNSRFDLTTRGLMDSTAVVRGEWWRLFTAVWLHNDIGHLATNAVIGFVLLGLTMGRFGVGLALAGACLTGVGGNLFAWGGAAQPHRSLGASGMVMGCLGMLAIQSLVLWRRSPHARKLALASLGGGVFLFLLLGSAPGTDLLAHLGGFLSGLLVGTALLSLDRAIHKTVTNIVAGIIFILLVIVPWYFALSR